MRQVEQILFVFAECSTATDNTLYFPIKNVGRVVHAALSMDREIKDYVAEVERLHRQIEEMKR
jgi:hypothetical protein